MPSPSEPQGALGIAVRRERKRAGLSQDALADACGVPQHQISRIERGRTEATFVEIAAIEAALNLPRGRLIIASGYVEVPNTTREWLVMDPLLDPVKRQAVMAVYDSLVDDLETGADDLDEDT